MHTENTLIDGKYFTCREMEVIKQVMKGLSRKQIQAILGKSTGTINAQFSSIYLKTGFHKVTQLIAWALVNGFDRKGGFKPVKTNDPQAKQIKEALKLKKEMEAAKAKEWENGKKKK